LSRPLSTLQILTTNLSYLSKVDRRRYYFKVACQVLASLFDILGILLIALLSNRIFRELEIVGTDRNSNQNLVDFFSPEWLRSAPIGFVAAAATLTFLVRTFLSLFLIRRMCTFLGRVATEFSTRLYRSYFALSIGEIEKNSSQKVYEALNLGINSTLVTGLSSSSIFISELTVIVSFFIFLIYVNWILAVGLAIYFGTIILILYRALTKKADKSGRQIARSNVEINRNLSETIRGYREIWTLGKQNYFYQQFEQERAISAKSTAEQSWLNSVPKYMIEGIFIVGVTILVLIVSLIPGETSKFAVVTVFLVAGSRVMPSAIRIQTSLISMRNSFGIAEFTHSTVGDLIFKEQLKSPEVKSNISQENPISKTHDKPVHIEIDNLVHRYEGSSFKLEIERHEFQTGKLSFYFWGIWIRKINFGGYYFGCLCPKRWLCVYKWTESNRLHYPKPRAYSLFAAIPYDIKRISLRKYSDR
jgi:ABC-type multidrug transport system fused ATPase/permease subunit